MSLKRGGVGTSDDHGDESCVGPKKRIRGRGFGDDTGLKEGEKKEGEKVTLP